MTDFDDIPLRPFRVACHVTGCENADIPLDILAPENPDVICGPCGQPITDITPIEEEGPS